MTYVSNNLRTIRNDAGEFMIEQRNVGFVPNDRRWVVSRLPELYWLHGELRTRREGKFLGVFDTEADAEAATLEA